MLFCSQGLFSQEVSLCEAFNLLVKAAPSNFEAYKSEKITDPSNGSKYNTTLKIKGAKSANIDEFLGYNTFTADFGTFNKIEQANFSMLELENEFKGCKPGFEFAQMKDIIGTSFNEVFVYKHTNGAIVYNAYFHISKKNDGFNLNFTLYKKDLVKRYVYLTNEPQQDTINQEVRKLIDARKSNFDEFKGELTNNGYVNYYSSKFCITGFSNCRIYPAEKRNFSSSIDNLSHFSVLIVTNVSPEDAKIVLKNATVIVAKSLGKGYAFTAVDNQEKVVFCLKEDVGQELKEFIVISTTKSFTGKSSCLLEIYATK